MVFGASTYHLFENSYPRFEVKNPTCKIKTTLKFATQITQSHKEALAPFGNTYIFQSRLSQDRIAAGTHWVSLCWQKSDISDELHVQRSSGAHDVQVATEFVRSVIPSRVPHSRSRVRSPTLRVGYRPTGGDAGRSLFPSAPILSATFTNAFSRYSLSSTQADEKKNGVRCCTVPPSSHLPRCAPVILPTERERFLNGHLLAGTSALVEARWRVFRGTFVFVRAAVDTSKDCVFHRCLWRFLFASLINREGQMNRPASSNTLFS